MDESIVIPRIIATGIIRVVSEIKTNANESHDDQKLIQLELIDDLVRMATEINIRLESPLANRRVGFLNDFQAALYLGCPIKTVHKHRKSGKLHAIRAHRGFRYKESDLQQFLQSQFDSSDKGQ